MIYNVLKGGRIIANDVNSFVPAPAAAQVAAPTPTAKSASIATPSGNYGSCMGKIELFSTLKHFYLTSHQL